MVVVGSVGLKAASFLNRAFCCNMRGFFLSCDFPLSLAFIQTKS